MQFHDFHLDGYVADHKGKSIVLHLVWDYPNSERIELHIRFSDVALYNFTHTAGAIITDIVEQPVSGLVREFGAKISDWAKLYGVDHWSDTLENYINALETQQFSSWCIESAIGFHGFVIASAVGNA